MWFFFQFVYYPLLNIISTQKYCVALENLQYNNMFVDSLIEYKVFPNVFVIEKKKKLETIACT